MASLDDAQSLAQAYLDEIDVAVEIRQTYQNIVVGQSGVLFGAISHDQQAKATLTRALRLKTSDANFIYKPLVVQAHGVFENFIRSLTEAVIAEKFETVPVYSELDEQFRNSHIAHVAGLLRFVRSGVVGGVPYNFKGLIYNFGRSITDQPGLKLNPEVYTKLMGNCTPDRLEKLFEALSLPDPFSDQLGLNSKLKAYFSDKAKGRVAERTKETLASKIDLRNNIVHGDLTLVVDLTELQDNLQFFRSLISALTEIAKK